MCPPQIKYTGCLQNRLRQQTQQLQLQQEELEQVQKEADEAKAALQAALHARDFAEMSQIQGSAQVRIPKLGCPHGTGGGGGG